MLKIGDKVKVRDNLLLGKSYGKETFVYGMNFLCGKTVTIKEIGHQYKIKEGKVWYWSKEMFE